MFKIKIPIINSNIFALKSNENCIFLTSELKGKLIPGTNHKFSRSQKFIRIFKIVLGLDPNDLGVLSRQSVTTVGVNFLRNAFGGDATAIISNFKYHASGDGTAAEAVSDVALGNELETRATGTQDYATAKIYKTVATISYTGTRQIREHGVFNASTGNILWDRSVFAVINVVSGDSIQFTYSLTINDGG